MAAKILIGIGVILLFGVLIAGVSVGLVVARSEQARMASDLAEQNTFAGEFTDLGSTRSLEILPLFEEAALGDALEPEHGVSYLVRTDTNAILLDVGAMPARLRHNMQLLHVDANDFDTVFITHLHPDHIGGLKAWWESRLVPGEPPLDLHGKRVFVPGAVANPDLDAIVVAEPQEITEGVATIGTLDFPEVFPLSLRTPRNREQVLAVNVRGRGIVLIMGCGHPTVERIVARAEQVFNEPVVGIVGGLHYEGYTREQARVHMDALAPLHLQLVAVSPHDSSIAALEAFREAFGGAYHDLAVGLPIYFGDAVVGY